MFKCPLLKLQECFVLQEKVTKSFCCFNQHPGFCLNCQMKKVEHPVKLSMHYKHIWTETFSNQLFKKKKSIIKISHDKLKKRCFTISNVKQYTYWSEIN